MQERSVSATTASNVQTSFTTIALCVSERAPRPQQTTTNLSVITDKMDGNKNKVPSTIIIASHANKSAACSQFCPSAPRHRQPSRCHKAPRRWRDHPRHPLRSRPPFSVRPNYEDFL
eukprot:3976992-Pleurochrysis_carterae.AAC.1